MEILSYSRTLEVFKDLYKEHPLRRKNYDVLTINNAISTLADDMYEILKKNKGVGLAAPQVGVSLMLFMAVINGEIDCYVNPFIKHRHGRQKNWESCLSLPGIMVEVPRAKKIEMEWYDLDGKLHNGRFSNENAVILQHEYDHLQGVLIIDYED